VLPVLQHELKALKAAGVSADDRVFPTQKGGPMNDSNVRTRIIDRAVELANKQLEKAESVPLPRGLSPHKLRHTFASVLEALGKDPREVMEQLGHTDPAFTFKVYGHAMRRDEQSKGQLRALVGVEDQEHAEAGARDLSTSSP
jgi:integrase